MGGWMGGIPTGAQSVWLWALWAVRASQSELSCVFPSLPACCPPAPRRQRSLLTRFKPVTSSSSSTRQVNCTGDPSRRPVVTCTVAAGGCRSLIDCTDMGDAYLCITLARQTRHLTTLPPIPSHVSCCIIAWPCRLEILGFFMNLTLLHFPISAPSRSPVSSSHSLWKCPASPASLFPVTSNFDSSA